MNYTFHMGKHLQKFILWLMIFAIPAQGFAAAGMLACSPGHASAAPIAVSGDSFGEPGHASRDDHKMHHQAASEGSKATPHEHGSPGFSLQAGDAAGIASSHDAQAGTTCSACAACCIGAALLPATVGLRTFDFSRTVMLAASPLAVSFVTDGPRRPPRTFPA